MINIWEVFIKSELYKDVLKINVQIYGHVFLFWGKYIGVEWIGYIKSLTF